MKSLTSHLTSLNVNFHFYLKKMMKGSFLKSVYLNWCLCDKSLSLVWFFATLWSVALQAALSTGFSRQEYWSGLLCPPPGDVPNPELKPTSSEAPALQADSLLLRDQGSTQKLIPVYVKWIAGRIQQMLLWISLVTSSNCSVYQEQPLNFTVSLKEKEGGLYHGRKTSQQKHQDLDLYLALEIRNSLTKSPKLKGIF